MMLSAPFFALSALGGLTLILFQFQKGKPPLSWGAGARRSRAFGLGFSASTGRRPALT